MKEQERLMIIRIMSMLALGLRHAEALERCLGRASCAAKFCFEATACEGQDATSD